MSRRHRDAKDHNIRAIEWAIRNENKIWERVNEVKILGCGHTGGAPTGNSYRADPTAAVAVRMLDELAFVDIDGRRLMRPEKWLLMVSAVRAWAGADSVRGQIFRRRYKTGESYLTSCRDLQISASTYHNILFEIRNYALQCGAQLQIIKVFDEAAGKQAKNGRNVGC